MTTINDAFGDWKELGNFIPTNFNEWYKFPETGYPIYTRSYRLSFTCQDFGKINSFAWLRPSYSVAGATSIKGRATRIYPKPDPILLEFPIPQDFLSRNIDYQDFEIKKILGRYQSRDILWSIKLEELQG